MPVLQESAAASGSRLTVTRVSPTAVEFTRRFAFPRALVFEAFSRPEHMCRWWGPRTVPITEIEMDFRAGGSWRVISRDQQGNAHPFHGEFREIVAPERIVMTQVYDVPPANEHHCVNTMVLEEVPGGTLLHGRSEFSHPSALDGYVASGMEGGMNESYQRLDELLVEADREFVAMRTFAAPRALVYEAFTDPAHLSEWWGPNGFSTTTYEHAVRPGGVWRFTMHGPDGTDWPNRVVYREVIPGELLVWEHYGADETQVHFVGRVTFADAEGNGTRVMLRGLAPSAEALAEMKKFGAIEGAQQNLERFGKYLEKRLNG